MRRLRKEVDALLATMSVEFEAVYATGGRPSVPPEMLLKALLLQILFSIRSERLLVEAIHYNLLYRWFVGLNLEDKVWGHSTFSANRERLFNKELARAFFERVKLTAGWAKLTSDEHFSVDGTQQPAPSHKAFKAYAPGYLHVDVKYLPQMVDEPRRRYLFVAIDRATRWVFLAIKPNKTAQVATAFLAALHKACPCKIQRLLPDNGREFSDRLFASRERQPSGHHEFDLLCQALGIEHRPHPPPDDPRPTAWSSASTVASPMCSTRIASMMPKTSPAPSTVTSGSTISSSHNQCSRAKPPCKP